MAKSRRLPPVLPGEVLREDLMTPLGLSINGLARDLRVPVTRMGGRSTHSTEIDSTAWRRFTSGSLHSGPPMHGRLRTET